VREGNRTPGTGAVRGGTPTLLPHRRRKVRTGPVIAIGGRRIRLATAAPIGGAGQPPAGGTLGAAAGDAPGAAGIRLMSWQSMHVVSARRAWSIGRAPVSADW
jgi:hypothetical protein